MFTWIFRVLLISLIVVLLGVSVLFYTLWAQSKREFDTIREREMATREKLLNLQEKREAREVYLRSFLNDPEFAERVIRERLGYVEPGETVFRFDR